LYIRFSNTSSLFKNKYPISSHVFIGIVAPMVEFLKVWIEKINRCYNGFFKVLFQKWKPRKIKSCNHIPPPTNSKFSNLFSIFLSNFFPLRKKMLLFFFKFYLTKLFEKKLTYSNSNVEVSISVLIVESYTQKTYPVFVFYQILPHTKSFLLSELPKKLQFSKTIE